MNKEEEMWIKMNLHPSMETYSRESRTEGEKLLKNAPLGRWILRASNPDDLDCVVTISSKSEEGFKHHRVHLEGKKFWIASDEYFSNVMELINNSRLLTHLTQPIIPLKTLRGSKKQEERTDDEDKKNSKIKKVEEEERSYDEDRRESNIKKKIEEEERSYDEDKKESKIKKKIEEDSPYKGESQRKKNTDEDIPKSPSSPENKKKEISKSKKEEKSGNLKSSKVKDSPSKSPTTKSKTLSSKKDTKKGSVKKEGSSKQVDSYVLMVMCGDKNVKMTVDEVSSIDDIVVAIGKQCSIASTFRVEYYDSEFSEYAALSDLQSLKDKKGKLRIVLEQRSEWQFSSKFLEHNNWQSHGGDLTPYRSILLKDQSVVLDPNEFKKLEVILEKYNVPRNTNITKVYAFQNDALERAFIFNYQSLQEKFRSSPGLFKKDGWMREKNSDARLWTYEQYKKKISKFDWTSNPDVPILPVFHGTAKDSPWKIIQTGFTTIAQVDDGFFGRGIYFTTCFDYSIFYSKNANKGSKVAYILVAFVLPGNPYPVIESPVGNPTFKGKGPADASGYQSHYVCVNSKSGHNTPIGFPCPPYTDQFYDELVIFQDYQAVPKYLLEVETNL